jgi:two-component system, OmpR family, response regulator
MTTTPLRVLVVDDSQDTARMMRVLLKGQGYEVKLAFAGREAIEVAKGFRPEVVLLDLSLPDLSGAEVAEELRGTEGFERTAFVAVSGHDSERIPSVFDEHFVKPLDHDALGRFLSRLASEGRRPENGGTMLSPTGLGS